jgi:hypothetical protein
MKVTIPTVAELKVTHSGGEETIRTFDKAWHRMRELAQTTSPVKCSFVGFVRLEK